MLAPRTLVASFALLATFGGGLVSCGLALGLDDYSEPERCDGAEDCPAAASDCSIGLCREGRCVEEYLPQFSPCVQGGSACDGAGRCVAVNGSPCVADDICASAHCADGVCCEEACTGDCRSCGNEEGKCEYLALGVTDEACEAPALCDGGGACARGEIEWATILSGDDNEAVQGITSTQEGELLALIPIAAAITVGEQQVAFAGGMFDSVHATLDADGEPQTLRLLGEEPSDVLAYSAAAPSGGAIVIGGSYIGSATIAGTPLMGTANYTMFLAGLDPATREELWATGYPDQAGVAADGVTWEMVSVGADVVAVGQFPGRVDFGIGAPIGDRGGLEAALWRVDSLTGALRWARSFGGARDDVLRALAIDPATRTYFAVGYSKGPASYGGEDLAISDDAFDPVVVAFDEDGRTIWSKNLDCSGMGGFAVDVAYAAGAIYLVGHFDGTLTVDASHVLEAGMPAPDGFVARLAAEDGSVAWAHQLGATPGHALNVAVDELGHVIVAAQAAGAPDFGGPTAVPVVGMVDAVLVSYTRDGDLLWTRDVGVAGSTQGAGQLAIIPGGIIFTGAFNGSVLLVDETPAVGAFDGFIARFKP
jgi:outer membrane protein assembly factor BamB